MRDRLSLAPEDLLARQSNWRHVLIERDAGPLNHLFGMGLGSYPRIIRARGTDDRPSDFHLEEIEAEPALTIAALTPFFIGQKIFPPPTSQLRLTFQWRAASQDARIAFVVCEKHLLYSENCRGQDVKPAQPGRWESGSFAIPMAGLGAPQILARPIEFAIHSPVAGTEVAIRRLSLTDDYGWEVLANRDFRHGMDRWIFTDDNHAAWRIFNLYLMLWFETGAAGLTAFAALCCLAIAGGARALRRGEAVGAAVIGAVVSFLVSGLFDNVMEAPRLAAVFLLICAAGSTLLEPADRPA